jgi:hypothetical protein
MTDRQSVAANTSVANALSGKVHEFLGRPSKVRLYGAASAVGLNMSFLIGSQSFCQDQEVNAQNRLPIVPDDLVVEAGGKTGDRLVLSYRNTTVGAITAFARVEVIQLA